MMRLMTRYWDGAFFAVFWTVAMLAWNWPVDVVPALILAACGALAGVLFHLAMRWWVRRQSGDA